MKVRRIIRGALLTIAIVAAIVVLLLVAVLTIDLGPSLRERAERAGSKLIDRPMHIGRLGIRLRNGAFVIENLRIDGVKPTDHPFFTAKRLDVSLYWWTFFRTREVLIKSIDMSDWDMQVEMADGHDTFIKIPKGKPGEKRSYTVTLARVDAVRGRFTYIDHGTWSTVSPNLTVHVDHDRGEYRGRASFSDGEVRIKNYLPLHDDMRCAFKIEGGKVRLAWIDLTTDGSHSVVSGDVDFGNWPEMLFRVRTDEVDFPRMRQIFFSDEKFRVTGSGKFNGTFHLYKGGRDLKGSFSSPQFAINGYAFSDLTGDLRWLPNRFDLTNASARFHGGTSHFNYVMAPLGAPQPGIATFDASYEDVDLASFTDYLKTQGLRLAGRATGRNVLAWPLGRFSEHRGEGQIMVRAPANAVLYSRTSAPLPQPPPREEGVPAPSNVGAVPDLGHLPIGGTLRYQYGPEWVEVGASSIATPATYVEFSGRTAYGDRSAIDFYARSGDWQESDRLLAAVITAFGSPTKTVSVGGYGEFTGRMLNSFRRPRIEGSFAGEQVRAFDVIWGRTRGKVVVDNGYVEVTDGLVTQGAAAELHTDGRFSLSTPRDDHGEEINAVVTLKNWPIHDLRHAFDLDEYPVEGQLGGEYHVFGAYRRPFGYGRIALADAAAYGEPFERGTGTMKLEGVGVRIEGIELAKGGGVINGGAYVSWDGKYSFNANTAKSRGIPVEQMAALKFANTPPLFGVITFERATGAGAFASPSYQIDGIRIADLFVGDEGLGQVTGNLTVRDRQLGFALVAASPRLAVQGSGQIAMAPGANATMQFQVTDTSLDPYIRAFEPRLSPFTSVRAGGTVRVNGPLTDLEHLQVEASVEQLDMKLFDYAIRNEGPMRLALVDNFLHLGGTAAGTVSPMRFVGADTGLQLSGDIDLRNQRVAVKAVGNANLGILQGFFSDILSSGRAQLSFDVQGPLRNPVFSGKAMVTNGRIRYFSLPHSIDAINGPVTFTAGAIWFGDPSNPNAQLTGQVGGGAATFGGRIDLAGFAPSRWDLSASGTNIRLRYPEGFNSVVDADLTLTGPYGAPTLAGTVNVRSALYARPIDPGLLGLAAAAGVPAAAAPAASASFPLRFNIEIQAPRALRVQNNLAQMVASADLRLTGTYDRPQLLGRATVDRGYATIEGRRYQITQGTIQFFNPARIEPWFDIETETRVRIPGQTYVINLQIGGTMRKLTWQINSDPPLPEVEAVSLLFGDIRNASDVQNVELNQLQRSNATSQQVMQTRLQQMLLSPLSYNVARVFEQTFGLDAFQLTPSLLDELQRWSPTARVTIGKQISSRVYLTISRSLYTPQEDSIYLLQIDQSDRMSWVISRNEDATYSVDLRVRRSF